MGIDVFVGTEHAFQVDYMECIYEDLKNSQNYQHMDSAIIGTSVKKDLLKSIRLAVYIKFIWQLSSGEGLSLLVFNLTCWAARIFRTDLTYIPSRPAFGHLPAWCFNSTSRTLYEDENQCKAFVYFYGVQYA